MFNKVNTFGWYKKRVYPVKEHNPSDWQGALNLARQWGEEIPIGIFYSVPRPTYESNRPALQGEPLAWRPFDPGSMAHLQKEFFTLKSYQEERCDA